MRNIRLVTIALTGAMLVMASIAYAQNPFAIDGTVTDATNSKLAGVTPQATKANDPSGATKELGPKNGSPQQLGDIHTATIPMLADTNPNGNNDLNAIWTQTQQDANQHYWLYFAWSRDSAGTGVIGIELQKDPSGCDYNNLLACNPWGNRAAGDVVFVWDTQGGATTIVKRTFAEVNGAVVLPACPQGFPVNQNANCSVVTNSVAVFSNSAGTNLRGEAAIDLTAEGIIPLNECVTFSNVIPFSGTGNSDSADIKDAILQAFPPITTCGIITVKKVLLNLTTLTRNFNYTVNRTNNDPVRPGETQITGTLTFHNDIDTHQNLHIGTNYKLDENAPVPSPFVKIKVFCELSGTTYTLFDSSGGNTVTTFPVQGGLTTACTIQNMAVGSPTASSSQTARLHDQLNVGGALVHAALAGTAQFSLWTTSNCQTAAGQPSAQVGSTITTDVVFDTAGKVAGDTTTGVANTLATNGISVPSGGTYYWKVVYSGDTVNTGVTFCSENTVITFNN